MNVQRKGPPTGKKSFKKRLHQNIHKYIYIYIYNCTDTNATNYILRSHIKFQEHMRPKRSQFRANCVWLWPTESDFGRRPMCQGLDMYLRKSKYVFPSTLQIESTKTYFIHSYKISVCKWTAHRAEWPRKSRWPICYLDGSWSLMTPPWLLHTHKALAP